MRSCFLVAGQKPALSLTFSNACSTAEGRSQRVLFFDSCESCSSLAEVWDNSLISVVLLDWMVFKPRCSSYDGNFTKQETVPLVLDFAAFFSMGFY